MIYELSQKFVFEAAHTLNRTIDASGSRRIHGHTYHAEITLAGEPESNSGMVQDLGSVRRHIEAIRELLDHQFLDDVEDLGPATLENLCRFIFAKLTSRCPGLVAVCVERPASGDKCVLRRNLNEGASTAFGESTRERSHRSARGFVALT
ncbi:6-carboxytetrahydropterin synthase [Variovorax humicola]|uniref:6-carboxy-5,6,7,8-tetrahydropterin synthase n=1 Tax=Variovorax humicola TaxID=1769758 RepID=A0ABU8WCN1_9BURK